MKFFKTFLAALLAFLTAKILIFIFIIFIFGVMAASIGGSEKEVTVNNNSVLKIDLADPIVDAPINDPMQYLFAALNGRGTPISLYKALTAIENAATDSRIKGIYINISTVDMSGSGASTIEELRQAIARFKESGKFVYAYGEDFSQGTYYLSSVADKVYLHPYGDVDWKGISMSVMFYKGLLDKLGVEAEIFRHGKFKSAVEPFMTDRMSAENRAQLETVVNSMWGVIVDAVAESRSIPQDSLQMYATNLDLLNAQSALDRLMVDGF